VTGSSTNEGQMLAIVLIDILPHPMK
jgi:hypothetical protein